ncbi:hypothetical protein T492DRAFT_844337 [Pavlovales sp. CCMP2436]|nr:hypothetical protein T492DRAFT_844337 [Pavlovales sp. CCMP2436]
MTGLPLPTPSSGENPLFVQLVATVTEPVNTSAVARRKVSSAFALSMVHAMVQDILSKDVLARIPLPPPPPAAAQGGVAGVAERERSKEWAEANARDQLHYDPRLANDLLRREHAPPARRAGGTLPNCLRLPVPARRPNREHRHQDTIGSIATKIRFCASLCQLADQIGSIATKIRHEAGLPSAFFQKASKEAARLKSSGEGVKRGKMDSADEAGAVLNPTDTAPEGLGESAGKESEGNGEEGESGGDIDWKDMINPF